MISSLALLFVLFCLPHDSERVHPLDITLLHFHLVSVAVLNGVHGPVWRSPSQLWLSQSAL